MSYVSEALEQQYAATAYLQFAFDNHPHVRTGASWAERKQWVTDIHALMRAETFYWSGRTVEAVNAAMPSFNLAELTCTRHILSTDVAFHWFADKSPFSIEHYKIDQHEKKEEAPVKAITWYWFGYDGKPYLGATAWIQSAWHEQRNCPIGPIGPAVWICIDANEPMSSQIVGDRLSFMGYSDKRTEWEMEQLKRWVVTASTFLRQEFLSTAPQRTERHARKRLALTKEALIHVVQLRRAAIRAAKDSEHVEGSVDWNYQWFVTGHMRRQWYASLGEHLPVYISPYLKGPDDKPLKPRSTPIFSVTR